jgi:hypothetical protein
MRTLPLQRGQLQEVNVKKNKEEGRIPGRGHLIGGYETEMCVVAACKIMAAVNNALAHTGYRGSSLTERLLSFSLTAGDYFRVTIASRP